MYCTVVHVQYDREIEGGLHINKPRPLINILYHYIYTKTSILSKQNHQTLWPQQYKSKESKENKTLGHSKHVSRTQGEKSIPAIINLVITYTPAPTQKLADARDS